jgi:hypothetical protein
MAVQIILDYFNNVNDSSNNSCKNKQSHFIELEIKVLLDPRIKLPYFINSQPFIKLCDDKNYINTIKGIVSNCRKYGNSNISQTINFIHTEKTHMFVKQLYFENGIQNKDKKRYYIKKALINPIYLVSNNIKHPSYKLSISDELDQVDDINNFDIIRFRLRFTIEFNDPNLKDWKLELTLIKETKSIPVSLIKIIRDRLFKNNINCDNFIDVVDWEYCDRIELELEYKGTGNIQINSIKQLDQLWNFVQFEKKTYSDYIYQIAQIIKPKCLDKFKSGYFGLKQLGSNPIELTKKYYDDDIRLSINNYILTEKIDGIRSMIIIYPKTGDCHIINKTYRYLKINIIPYETIELIILDTEEYIDSSLEEPVYYVFDCIWYNKNIHKLPFADTSDDRIGYVEKSVEKYTFLKSKHFIYLNKCDYHDQINEFNTMINSLNYDTDGFIFISKNENYNETKNYKWKPLEKMTIDFVSKKCPNNLIGITPYLNKDNKTLYLLFSGIRNIEYNKLGVEKLKNYDTMFKQVSYNDKYFPIQFKPSSDPYAYLFWSNNDSLDNKVIELSRTNDEWKLFKIRPDRKIDMDRKSYYGNYFKYAEYIWMNYRNPLTISYMIQLQTNLQSNSYFQEDNNNKYTTIRKFNNYVKDIIINMYNTDTKNNTCIDWVIDLASGKGQDLFKYIDSEIKNILMIDIDETALSEVIRRKYLYINNNRIKTKSNIFIKQLDLTNPYKQNIESINDSSFGIPSSGVPLIICNLALHYLIPTKTKTQNFCNLLNKFLEPGGIFICTTFDGKKIFDLLKEQNSWDRYRDGKLLYSIKKNYTSCEFTGLNQKIDVLLPFSNGEYYSEYLINDDILENELLKKKISLVNSDSFDIYLNKFKICKPKFYNLLMDIDIEFISLYKFYIFHKSNNIKCNKSK